MANVAAGVHLAGIAAKRTAAKPPSRIGKASMSAARSDHAIAGRATLDDSDDAGPADPGDDFVASERAQAIRDQTRRAMHVVEQFGVGVKIAPPFRDLFREMGDSVVDGHGGLLRSFL